ncbi:hypothetical protein K443DRAFT_12478 [Laccaria amethystina LaAM-08-1]|uniref:Uncharacterized protein n=1 Tax=Laccaria amethystina LaAM-08-1 TaxID=1095629 RepID=A0A0C9XCL9_9AGAR|nr:hypothetical protein K443DRAFT_12478 [Laccaria amethystina LaAM-08-1]
MPENLNQIKQIPNIGTSSNSSAPPARPCMSSSALTIEVETSALPALLTIIFKHPSHSPPSSLSPSSPKSISIKGRTPPKSSSTPSAPYAPVLFAHTCPPGPLQFEFLLPEAEAEEAETERACMKTCPTSVHVMIEVVNAPAITG